MNKRTDFHKIIIGRAEELSFVDLGIANIPAKIDTGAYRSAVHANNITLSKDGKTLSFNLLGGHPVYDDISTTLQADTFSKVVIENSFGHREERYEVSLRVKLGPKIFTANFSLADRSKKVYPILIGRQLLNGRFLVDTNESSVSRQELKQNFDILFDEEKDL